MPTKKKKIKLPMLKAYFRLPMLRSYRLWVGAYGGHFNVVALFSKKPKVCHKDCFCEEFPRGYYSMYDNKDIVVATIDPETFKEWFGLELEPEKIEIETVRLVRITGPFNSKGQLEFPNFHIDE